jgi:glycosyltransferase involved in cell wall biosynthesis
MRIAFLHQPNDPYTIVRIKYFVSRRHEVFSVVFSKKFKQNQLNGVKVIALKDYFINKIPIVKRFLYWWRIRQITEEYQIDIFYVISALNSLYLKASGAKRNILEIQGSDVIIAPGRIGLIKIFYKYFWKFADAITQDSELSRSRGRMYMPKGIINQTIEIGVDFQIFNPDVEGGIMRNKFNLGNRPVLFHSRSLKKLYNIDTLIESLPIVKRRFGNICYVLTGNKSSLSEKSQKLLKKYHLEENVIFCGMLDHTTEIKYFYKDAEVVVSIPSSDSSPFSVYEAMASKTPVIVSDLPWFEGKFIPGKHLLSVPVKSSSSLAEAIIQVLDNQVQLDIDSAYKIVYTNINMITENQKLELLFYEVLKL